MIVRGFLTTLSLSVMLLGSAFSEEKAPAPDVVASTYFSKWVSGDICEGIDTCWDVNRCFVDVFGEDYKKLSASDRSYLQHIFTVFMVASNKSPAVMASLKGAKVTIGGSAKLADDKVRVTAKLTTGDSVRELFADLVKTGAGWKITNLGNGQRGLEALKPAWDQYKTARGADATIVEWWEVMLSQIMSAKYAAPKKGESDG